MCRLAAITSSDYFSPMEPILALNTMKEGHDGAGLGLVLKNLGGEFEEFKDKPILSAICSKDGKQGIENHLKKLQFKHIRSWEPHIKNNSNIPKHDHYLADVYDYPDKYKEKSFQEKEAFLTKTRLELRELGEGDGSIYVFSFYPDILSLKEVGDPLELAEFFGLDNKTKLEAKIIFAQGRQNTNYKINLYACHPFFLQGICTMTNGENTAFVPIREYLTGRNLPGYVGYNSDSEVFCHILHYTYKKLGYPLHYYKDVITPLKQEDIDKRPDADAITYLKRSLRPLCIDGPNCVIGFIPDGTCFMVQDAKKLRPGTVGGLKGKYALMSEECGLESVVPGRDRSEDIFPMKFDMVIIKPDAEEVMVWNQLHG